MKRKAGRDLTVLSSSSRSLWSRSRGWGRIGQWSPGSDRGMAWRRSPIVSQLRARPPRTTSVVFRALPSRSFRLPFSIPFLSLSLRRAVTRVERGKTIMKREVWRKLLEERWKWRESVFVRFGIKYSGSHSLKNGGQKKRKKRKKKKKFEQHESSRRQPFGLVTGRARPCLAKPRPGSYKNI